MIILQVVNTKPCLFYLKRSETRTALLFLITVVCRKKKNMQPTYIIIFVVTFQRVMCELVNKQKYFQEEIN